MTPPDDVNGPPHRLDDAAVVLHLLVEVPPGGEGALRAFCERAFPVYESVGGCRMVLYQDAHDPVRFDEVGYYRTLEDYRRSEAALTSDPQHAAFIAEWRQLLAAPPVVKLFVL